MQKKKLFTMVGALALVGAIGIGSTFAYLTSQTGEVTNTFTVGNVNFDLNSGLKESTVTKNEAGEYVDADGANTWTSDGNDYVDLYAGQEVLKDPTVTMAEDSQDAWVFAKIENPSAAVLAIALNNDWEVVPASNTAITDTVVYLQKKTVISAEASSTIFNSVTVSTDVTSETEFSDITVKACAVQATGLSQAEAFAEATFETPAE